ncbi:hypothetical protein GCK72_001665 [Caenorhabditis remanei]|uniref:Smr domain-containing protein n=1 Tax=Caenorhabditis remanei TaxID=31234 RepID=A0A6A5HPK6_CAERE|nr:hypothetical protein GCK72_001665 [Caenorhabditis remanei]KAF1769848.1 hypothetical protein GCK72_001665 [Caenorhabditis remanei]
MPSALHVKRAPRGVPKAQRETVVKNPKFVAMEKDQLMEMSNLFAQRNKSRGEQRDKIQKAINLKVASWNDNVLLGKTKFDLHGMTPDAAVDFVLEKIKKKGNYGELTLITYREKHSTRGIPRIKMMLVDKFTGRSRCSIKEEVGNPGRLVLNLW